MLTRPTACRSEHLEGLKLRCALALVCALGPEAASPIASKRSARATGRQQACVAHLRLCYRTSERSCPENQGTG